MQFVLLNQLFYYGQDKIKRFVLYKVNDFHINIVIMISALMQINLMKNHTMDSERFEKGKNIMTRCDSSEIIVFTTQKSWFIRNNRTEYNKTLIQK